MRPIEYYVLSKQFDTESQAKTWAIRCCKNLAKTNGVSVLKWHKNNGWFVIIPISKSNRTDMRFKTSRNRSTLVPCTLYQWLCESTKNGNAEITPLYVCDDADKVINITYEVLI